MEHLGARYWRFKQRVLDLAAAFQASTSATTDCAPAHPISREGAIIQLQDQWSVFCRGLIIRSWVGDVRTLGGREIPIRLGHVSPEACLSALRATYTGKSKKRSYWEPKWFDANEAIDAARRLQLPNAAEISAGLGLTPSPLDEIRAVRNFIAHKGLESASRLRRHGARASAQEVDAFVLAPTVGGASRFERWVAQLDVMAYSASG